MTTNTLILGAKIINEGNIIESDVYLKNGRIDSIGSHRPEEKHNEVRAEGLYLMPGIIDDQVHFREPGYTQKADIHTESRAAAAGGVTSFMEMPNTKPVATDLLRLEEKYDIARQSSYTNYSFFLGASTDNLDQIQQMDPERICGIKIFMGSSTGDLLVDDDRALENIFRESPTLIATHCEDEAMFRARLQEYKVKFCDHIPASSHEFIRSKEGCLLSSSKAVHLARKFGSRLHILHISTAEELALFPNDLPLLQKKITSEVCVHHLYFDASDYATLENKIKCNPSIKSAYHRKALFEGLLEDRLDIIATDHAPHLLSEKIGGYLQSASGLPLVQHALVIMLDFYHQGKISLEKLVTKMCHAPADCFKIRERGYIREGYHADLVLLDPNEPGLITKENIFYKCGWSPLEGKQFRGRVVSTWVNGFPVYDQSGFGLTGRGQRLLFDR